LRDYPAPGMESMTEQLTKNFSRAEFACKGNNCCDHSAPVHPLLVEGLQRMRDAIGKPVTIVSGYRCRMYNRIVSDHINSYHTIAMAADISCSGMFGAELAEYAEEVEQFKAGGIGIYNNTLHVDVRTNGPARWDVT